MGTITEAMQNAINIGKAFKEEIYINDVHDYDYVVDCISQDVCIHSLYCSQDDSWGDDLKGKMVVQLMDDGNGVEINNINTSIHIDYLELEQLHILLRLHSSNSKYERVVPSNKTIF
jgi:hypothetical protein